ncbi:MAG: tripartite tricarboxylate transporter substrate-binding protein [Pseudomonadota bacterium]
MKVLKSLVCIAALTLASTSGAFAQGAGDYPNKPVRMIVPFAPGGPADIIARIVAIKLSEELGKQFYVENHAGAGGNLGAGVAARAPADGYSLMVNSQTTVINPHLYKSVPYDHFKDFVAITRIATSPNVLVVHPSVPAKTVKELVELIKKEPHKYTGFAQPGLGTPAHLSGEMFRLSQHLDLPSIPFGGGGPMIQSVVAGHTPIAFSSLPPAAAQIQAGNLRPLAVTGEKRIDSLPSVPTLIESGYPGQTGETPVGIYVQTGTPKEVGEIIRAKVVKIIAMPDVKDKLAAVGFIPIGDTPEEFNAYLRAESEKWGKVIREGKITVGQ